MELEKLKLEYSEFCEKHPIVKVDTSVTNLDSLIGVTRNTRDNLIAKISGAEKKLKSIKNENLSLFKKYGPKIEKAKKEANKSKKNDSVQNSISPAETKKKRGIRKTNVEKPAKKDYEPSPEQKVRLEEIKSEMTPMNLKISELLNQRDSIYKEINGNTDIKFGQEAVNEQKELSTKIEKIMTATNVAPEKKVELTSNIFAKYREKKAEVHPKGLVVIVTGKQIGRAHV